MKNKDEYFKILLEGCPKGQEKEFIIKAYDIALDTRKFEIEMYWKRATYFWGFIAAIFLAYCAILSVEDLPNKKILVSIITLLGVFFSLGWFFVARGSKVWQENWEMHINYLEEEINGPLFKIFNTCNICLFKISKGYPYSVSKVNQVLSLYVSIFWIVIFLHSLAGYFDKNFLEELSNNILGILFVIVLIFGCVYLHCASKSFLSKIKIDVDNQSPFYFEKREKYQSVLKKKTSLCKKIKEAFGV